ncbi:hypothetical protein, partial [Legionella sp. 29fVS95]|uniref:hypothetical protein n=1 Tax=Legionella sp. 29fVS95 TaxID=3402813 RepID=UPI003AF9687C
DTKQFYTGYTKEELLCKEKVDISEMYHNEMLHFLTCITTNQNPQYGSERILINENVTGLHV